MSDPIRPVLSFFIEGEPSTDHRPRTRVRGSRATFHMSHDYGTWKDTCRLASVAALAAWVEDHGEWPLGDRWRYVVRTYSVTAKGRKDADNTGRGFRDAAQGILWKSDHRCRPVNDDGEQLGRIDFATPGLFVEAVPYQHAKVFAEVSVTLRILGESQA